MLEERERRVRAIRVLSPLLVNQIAAGEVVERPASVVKELMDNALDAGAGRVVVELEGGGVELVRVVDDGWGIGAGELGLAVAAHATSKISEAGDLDRIGTLGFRGEALASIASVSRLTLRSRARGAESGGEISAEGEAVSGVWPAASPVGTSVTVRNLFFNTPARRKFLRTVGTEQAHCLDVVRQLAMAHPRVGFTAVCDGRVVVELAGGQSARERALAVLGPELEGELVEVGADEFDDARGVALWGLVGTPAIARATAKCQNVFLNGRPVRDKTVQHALREGYRGLIEPGRYPTAVVMLEMSPTAVDVNVHPAKAEVRFRDPSLVHSVVLRAVREALARADLTPTVREAWSAGGGRGGGELPGAGSVGGAPTAQESARALADYFSRGIAAQTGGRFSYEAIREAIRGSEGAGGTEAGEAASAALPAAAAPGVLPAPTPVERLLQVHNSYVVTQDPDGIVIVDQHALHERALYEHLLARITAGDLESQRLLMPVTVPATARQAAGLVELAPLFERIGVVAEPIGPGAVAVHAFPTFLFERGVDAGEFVRALLERTEDERFVPSREDALHEVLDMMACKAAVKAGDRMSEGELRGLLDLRRHVERASNCPHGRPTSIRLTIRELERLFGRT